MLDRSGNLISDGLRKGQMAFHGWLVSNLEEAKSLYY
jgi:hypothetical protein